MILSKMSITKKVLLNWYSLMKKKLRKILMIFDIENWLFDSSPLIQNSKFNNFLWVCLSLFKNLSNFVPSAWKLHKPYCHNNHIIVQTQGGILTLTIKPLNSNYIRLTKVTVRPTQLSFFFACKIKPLTATRYESKLYWWEVTFLFHA